LPTIVRNTSLSRYLIIYEFTNRKYGFRRNVYNGYLFTGQQQRFFFPSTNNGNFAVPRFQFQDDTDSAELIIPERRISSAESLPLSNPSSSSFFTSQQQLPPRTFTNSGPFSRPPTAQQFILNGQHAQFQPIRNSGSLSFTDAIAGVPQPSFYQQAPIQEEQQQQQNQQEQQKFNFFPGNTQQQRFRPIVQHQRTEQPDSIDHFNENQNPQPSLTLQQSSHERFAGDLSRRPVSQTNRITPGARTPSPTGSIGWWNPSTADAEPVTVNSGDQTDGSGANNDGLNQPSQHQKRGRGQPQQGKRKPTNAPALSAIPTLEQQRKPAAIGFTVIHDDQDDDRSSWSHPIITTHRPQPGQISIRNRNSPTVAPSSTLNRRPTTYNPLSVVTTSTSVRSPLQLSESSVSVDRQQPTTVRSRKSSVFSTTTTTAASTFEDDEEQQEEEKQEQLPLEEKREFQPRTTSTTTRPTPVPITTLRSAIRPRLNSPAVSIPQQQRMKKIVNNPAIIQSVTTRKPALTSTLPPKVVTNVPSQVEEEYEEYEEYTTTELLSNKKQTKLPSVTQPSTTATNQNNNSLIASTESWFVVASVQTSRSVSSSINKNLTVNEATTSVANTSVNKHRFNNKPTTTTTTSTTTVESIIDKLDRVQSELSNGILYGTSSATNNSRILTDLQNSNNDKRNDVIISSFTTPTTEKTTENTIRTTTSTTTVTSTTINATSSSTTEKEEDEVEDKEGEEEEEDESNGSDKETTFVRKFVPSKQRTTIGTTTSTVKPPTQAGKKKSLIDTVKFEELLTSGLLPAGFNPKAPPAYKSKIITTTTTTEISLPVTNSTNVSQPNIGSSGITINTTPSTVKPKLSGLNIKFVDDSSALASLLPPGFKLEETIKPVESLSPSLLPPGYKPSTENVDVVNVNTGHEPISTTVTSTTEVPLSTTTAQVSTTGIVFPNSAKGNSGTRKPLPSSKKIQASVTVAPVIQKGWPVR